MKRALTSASNLARREACPGSAAAEAMILATQPEVIEEDSEDSAEGTLLHELDANPDDPRHADLKPEQRDVLAATAEIHAYLVKTVCESYGIPAGAPCEESREGDVMVMRGMSKVIPGHYDRLIHWPDQGVALLIDNKFGRREVTPADGNVQLRTYAVGAARKYQCAVIVVAICQPRLPWNDRVTMAEYTAAQIPEARDHLLAIYDGAHQRDGTQREDRPLIPDADEQCRYCLAKKDCRAYRAKYHPFAVAAGDGKEFYIGRIARMTDAELDFYWEGANFAVKVRDDLKAEVLRRMEAGGMPMYQQRAGADDSRIVNPADALPMLGEVEFDTAEVMNCTTLWLGKLEEAYRAKHGGTAKAAKERIRTLLAPVIEQKTKAPSLVRIKDWTPALPSPAGEAQEPSGELI